MARRLFAVPAAWAGRPPQELRDHRGALACVWIETGNPKQPLACVWIDRAMRIAGTEPELSSELEIGGAGPCPAQDGHALVCA